MDPNPIKPNTENSSAGQPQPQQESSSSSRESPINPEHHSQNLNSKGCNCKKSKCMKMYCECFFSGIRCTQNCRCLGCENVLTCDGMNHRPEGQDELEANRKIKIQNRGCNCKKSECSKKYCECFNAGIFCNTLCKCQQCKNILNGQISQQNNQNPQEQKMIFGQNTNLNWNQHSRQSTQPKQLKQKNLQFNYKLEKLLASVSEEYKSSMLEFVYYLLK